MDSDFEEEEYIIWNPTLGVRDFVTIGETKTDERSTTAWLDDPYDMVGPFCLDELASQGEIRFAACVVMTKQRWQEERVALQQEAFEKQRRAQEQHRQEMQQYNRKKQQTHQEERKLLCLPVEGVLKVSQIKEAYRQISKKAHPDVGGNHEVFIQITQARDLLLAQCS